MESAFTLAFASAPRAAVALFFENRVNLFKAARNSVHLFRYASRLSTQSAFKKFVQCHFDRTEIVTRNGFQEAVTGQRINFSVMNVKRYAAQPASPAFTVP